MEYNMNYLDDLMKIEYIKEDKRKYFKNKKLKVEKVYNGIILPAYKEGNKNASQGAGGVIDSNNKYIKLSAQLAHNMVDRVNKKYNISKYDVTYINETVVYLNHFYKHWGHFLIDIISRMWYIIQNPNKYKVVFTDKLGGCEKIEGNYLELLKIFGLKEENIIYIDHPTRFKKIIIPECSIYPGKYFTKEFKKIFKHISNNVEDNIKIPEKIYLSRSLFKKSLEKEIGESSIEKFFNDNDYVSIHPERLPLREQIQYYKNSKEIVCINGTLSHNIVFSRDKTKIIIINKTYKLNKNQELINQLKNANVTYIDCHISLFPISYGKGPFIIVNNNNLKRFAKENNLKWKKTKLSFIKNLYYILWYIVKYFKKYNKIQTDDKIKTIDIFKYYLLRW